MRKAQRGDFLGTSRDMSLHQFSILEQFSNLSHGISDRHTEDQQDFDIKANQVHGNSFVWVDNESPAEIAEVDGLLTNVPGLRIRIGVHDCTPIIVYNPEKHMGAVVHAGFRGTLSEVLPEVLNEFDVARTYVGIGPAIGACCYENIDIQRENYMQAIQSGVPEDQIEVIDLCTQCNIDTFYSHRGGDSTNFGAYLELL